jgi:CRP-like cAMP-binding protein
MMSMLSGKATPLQTMLLEDCRLLRLTREDYLKLGETEIGMVLTKTAAENSFMHKQQQQIDLLTKTAQERYDEFLVDFPGIVNRISQKHIASYLGITPQSFSRLKKSK